MGTTTTNLSLYKPAVAETGWGGQINANFDTLDERLNPLAATVMYVHPSGDDANDGLSWGTAKETILGAYDDITSGQINIYHGSHVGGEVAQQGIWIIGPNDASYASPPSGWRQQKQVAFQGVPNVGVIQFAKPSALFRGGTTDFPYDTASNLPCIWLSGTNVGITFRDLHSHYISQGIRAGIDAAGDRDTNTSQVVFHNVNFNQYNAGVSKSNPKPTVELGYVFWFWFNHCTFHAYPLADLDSDERAAIMQQGDTLNGGLTTIENTTLAGGGIRYHATGATSWSVKVRDVVMEGDFVSAAPSVVEIIGQEASGQGYLERVEAADTGVGSNPSIVIDSRQSPLATLVVDCSGAAVGPCTIMGGYYPSWAPRTTSVAGAGQFAVASPVGVVAPLPAARRAMSPVTVPYPNIANQTDWGSMVGSATVTTGQRAPDGTTNAVKLSSTGRADRQPWRGSRAMAAGDWLVVGAWVKGNGTYNLISTGLIEVNGNPPGELTFTTTGNIGLALPWYGDEEWQFIAGAKQVDSVNSPVDLVFSCRSDTGKDAYFYLPVLLHIPASDGLTESEVMEILYSLQGWPKAALQGETSVNLYNRLYVPNGMRMVEQSDIAAPATNNVVIYARDTGGKTELVARFPTGAIQQIAIEP